MVHYRVGSFSEPRRIPPTGLRRGFLRADERALRQWPKGSGLPPRHAAHEPGMTTDTTPQGTTDLDFSNEADDDYDQELAGIRKLGRQGRL